MGADRRIAKMVTMRRAGMTYPEIASAFDVTPERVRQMISHLVPRERAWKARKIKQPPVVTGPSEATVFARKQRALRNKEMLRLRLKGETYAAIALKFGLTWAGVRKAIYHAEMEAYDASYRRA